MNTGHLVQMANQIAEYHAVFPKHEEAVDGVANHLRRFWEPRMRSAIYEHLDGHKGAGLHPLVIEALTLRAELIRPRAKPAQA